MSNDQILSNADITIKRLEEIFANAGFKTESFENRIVINHEGTVASVYLRSDVISIFTSFQVKPEVNIDDFKDKILELNSAHSLSNSSLNEAKNKLVISMTYLTSVGVYIPHFIFTINGYFAFQTINFKRIDCSEFIE
ncbi:hypothetical protein ACJP8O_002478 [Enterobacter hormaechei]|jgi:hypothetical protein|uniref:Uncharacterized protein n=1 Tax=Enterobacter hormaechei TaxID=158836 RepID=A0A9X7Q5Y3_9ENTR|nr:MULTISPECIES: hypothetical protein [Enterobacteriaceae]MBT1721859.1 hypothetical protein [Enterobacter hormaechei subsp. hoffmannii]AOP82307.1 hypothetical protein BFV66_09865 [Enterobacter hormaechei subsp. oharae]EKX4736624.1 hypothetical protein [Enterobacter hormaechei]ELT6448657.1 hypothetical protein [Enterobacter hormaechei]EMC9798163.1 hypothetical protein [Enterobacter hormaechei]